MLKVEDKMFIDIGKVFQFIVGYTFIAIVLIVIITIIDSFRKPLQ